jgi:hypothetical protein
VAAVEVVVPLEVERVVQHAEDEDQVVGDAQKEDFGETLRQMRLRGEAELQSVARKPK